MPTAPPCGREAPVPLLWTLCLLQREVEVGRTAEPAPSRALPQGQLDSQ